MPVFCCDLCPISFLTQEELTSHKSKHHNLQIDSLRVLNSALTPGSEVLVAANTIYWMSRGRKCPADYGQPIPIKLDASEGPPSAKRRRGTSKLSPLVQAATSMQVYRCNECPMVFPSYHALGGHTSGHRKAEARFRATAAQINQVPQQQQPQLQPQEAPPQAPPSPGQSKYLFDLNKPAPE